ncbi:MAG: hypothetical protein V1876_04490, partial [Candidatus Peregrinibacteria bacterium]
LSISFPHFSMQMNKFTLGAIAGIATLTLAVPLLAQISSAADTTVTSAAATSKPPFTRPAPTQQQVQDMAARDAAFLKNIDALMDIQKRAVQAHQDALTAAASIADDLLRRDAVQKADEDERTAIQSALTAAPDLQSAMMPFGQAQGLRPFGGGRGHGEGKDGPGMMGRGPNVGNFAAKLGMTEAELKAALDGGKTIEQIATEKGVTLPARMGGKGRHGGWMGRGPSDEAAESTSSDQ